MACSAVAAAAAGWLVSPFLDNLSSRLRSYADDLLRYLPLSESASADLERLKVYLLRLHAYASTVERARAHRRPPHPTLLTLLNRLQDAAYDADDILDEIDYRRLADALIGPRPDLFSILDTPGQLCSHLVSVCSDHPLKRLPSVLDKLANACADYAGIASLVGIDGPEPPQRGKGLSENSSSIIPADDAFFGRQRELHVLIEMLVGGNGSAQLRNQSVPVVAIVGDGGIGKTKLAQMAFNHVNIQEHFDPLMWVCVSSHLDDMRITREILQAATDGKVHYDGIVNFDRLQKLLVSAVAGRRFLLVLDDVWDDSEKKLWDNKDRWRKLLAPLQNGNQESRIIVTTRMKMVADMLGVRIPLMLGGLGTEENWLLLKKCALVRENSREYSLLQEIGRKIASNLNGSPLAARVIGGLLSTRTPREWNSILETGIHGDIVSTLLSSYYHLPQHLQYCFAYCSIFPKNWKFERKKLVRMWIAQGFVQMENGSMEDAGVEYFKQLLARSFFHTLRQGNRTHYVMHDLIHDLAQMVSRYDCARMEGNKSKSIPSTVRHVSVTSKSLARLKEQCDLRRLRTLVVFKDPSMTSSTIQDDFLAEVKNVRTLDLTGCLISEVPEAIGRLIHLRYIALPDTIKKLPESVSMLLHLQTLDIPKKCQLNGFPKGMHLLVNLRHLGMDLTYISMIRGIGTLVNLQGSIEFHVKKEHRQSLVELKDMNDLHGLLHIKYLENVQCQEEALNAELSHKTYLKILKLEWNSTSSAFDPIRDAEVLEGLEPNPNLEELHIKRYKGESSPSWLEVKILSQLKSLYLTNCRRWKLLPSLGQLPVLKVLHLKEMCSVTEIGPKFYGGSPVSFRSLKYLEFDDMPNLVRWIGANGASFFPCLQKLKILNCPKLIEVPLLPPTTKSVTVERTQKISNLKLTPYCSSKSRKFILEISSGRILSEGFLHQKHLEAIEVLNVRGCRGLEHAGGFWLLSSLRKLRLTQCNMDSEQLSLCLQHITGLGTLDVVYCQNITSFLLPAGSRHFETLQHLCFQDCQMLSSLANLDSFVFLKSLIIERCIRVTAESLPAMLEGMRSLNKLSILHCPGFQTLPSNIPSSLEFLHLSGCHPMLIQGLSEKQGPEWEKIAPLSLKLSDLAEISSALHSYKIIPLLQESGIEKGIGEHEQERRDIYGATTQASVSRSAKEVYLAMGDDAKQCEFSLQWTLSFFPPQMSLVLLYVNMPVTVIPREVLGASWKASMLSEEVVSNYSKKIRNKIERSLRELLQNFKVQAKILIIERPDIAPALLEIVKKRKITTLVMGAKSRYDWKSKTAIALEKQADPSCNIWYLYDGILISSRHQCANVFTETKNEMSLGGCHFSSSSNTTTSKSSSFFNSRSTNDTFNAEQLNDPSLDINPKYIFDDQRFNAIVGLQVLDAFRGLVSQQISAECSRHLYQAFHSQYCDIFTRCEFIGGFDSVLGVDHQHSGKTHWKHMSSWPAELEYIVSILNTLHTRLKQSQVCDGFTHDDLLKAAKKPLRRLFSVASVVCAHEVSKSPEKLFFVLDMYTSLTDAIPDLWNVFHTDSISTDAEGLLSKLKGSATRIVKELRSLVQNYSSQRAVQEQDGGITSLTAYLMRYIKLLMNHKSSLDTILGHGHTDDLLTVKVISPTGRLVFELNADLYSALKKQSRSLPSKELQCLFLMNNTDSILQEVKKSDLRLIVGSRWIGKLEDRVKKHMEDYLSASWGPVKSSLDKRLRTSAFGFLHSSPTPVQNFSWSFDETCQTQMSWKVPNPVLREELRGEILTFLTQAYHAHLERVNKTVKGNAAGFKLEWKSKINELFEG